MKQGKTLMELAESLQKIRETSRDFIVPTEKLEATENQGNVMLNFVNGQDHSFNINNHSGQQISSFAKIPQQYFKKLSDENPKLLAENINHGFNVLPEKQRLLRTVQVDNKPMLRGFVSDRYRRLDSYDLLESIFPTFEKNSLQVVSSEITEQRMYIKALSPKLKTEVKKDDVVQYGLVISNSDVGAGSVRVEPLIYRLVCLNGMISNTAMRKYHVGKSQAENDIYELLSDSTKDLDDKVFWAKVIDLVEASLRPDKFEQEVDRLRLAANQEIKSPDPARVVELTMKATGLIGENKSKSIIAALASGNEGSGYTKYGLINSFTKAAQKESFSYEESIEMERAAGKIIELKDSQWERIAASA